MTNRTTTPALNISALMDPAPVSVSAADTVIRNLLRHTQLSDTLGSILANRIASDTDTGVGTGATRIYRVTLPPGADKTQALLSVTTSKSLFITRDNRQIELINQWKKLCGKDHHRLPTFVLCDGALEDVDVVRIMRRWADVAYDCLLIDNSYCSRPVCDQSGLERLLIRMEHYKVLPPVVIVVDNCSVPSLNGSTLEELVSNAITLTPRQPTVE